MTNYYNKTISKKTVPESVWGERVNCTDSKFLTNLQSLRALAFCAVILSHTSFPLIELGSLGAWGVSIFFVLSGFLLVFRYYKQNRLESCNILNNLIFAYAKLKKLILLHIICIVSILIFSFIGKEKEPITLIFTTRFILNCFLIQEWIPFELRSINGVSWFLCTILLGYFLFPYFLKLLEKNNYTNRKAILFILLCIAVELVIGQIGKISVLQNIMKKEMMTNDITYWLCYNFPLTRVCEIIIGFNLGYIFLKKQNIGTRQVTLLELFGLIYGLFSCYLMTYMNNTGDSKEKWWIYSLIFILSSMILVYSFALQKGKLSIALTNRITIYLARISPYGFLIHSVVFNYLIAIYNRIPGFEKNEFFTQYGGYCQITIGIAISIICSDVYLKLYSRFISKSIFG